MAPKIMLLLLALLTLANYNTPAHQIQNYPQPYTAQLDDMPARLAQKYYDDALAWPAIWLATNQQAQTDNRFTPIDSPYFIRPGQRLWLPQPAQVDELLARYSGPNWPAPPQLTPLGAAWLANFARYIDQSRQHFGIPGVALAVVRGNQIVLAQGFGRRELGQNEPVTPETLFAIGSTTKAMNATLIATLVDDGVLHWNQPVVELWPNFSMSDPAITPQIRLSDMLNMGSGVPRADLRWSGAGLTAEQIMESLAQLPLNAPPGQQFQYNNQMVATGGYVAALAAGGRYGHLDQAYAGLLQTRLFEPVGMRSATLSVEAVQANPNHATPHDFTLFAQTTPTYFHTDTGVTPAGGVYANALDMARFLITQLNRGVAPTGRRVVSAENLTHTWQPQIEAYPDTGYGLGWFIEDYNGVKMVWHDGDVLGFKSLLVFVPEANVGLALLTNRTISYGFSNSARYRLVEALYGLDVEAGAQFKAQWDAFINALPGITAPLTATPPPQEVAPYLGQYEAGWWVEQHSNGTLWAIRGPYRWQLLWAGNGETVVSNGFGITTPLNFTVDQAGQVGMSFKLSTGEAGEYRRLE